jgi:hypothetical protein
MCTESCWKRWGPGCKEVRERNGRGEWTKIKYTHSGDKLRNPVKINVNILSKVSQAQRAKKSHVLPHMQSTHLRQMQ